MFAVVGVLLYKTCHNKVSAPLSVTHDSMDMGFLSNPVYGYEQPHNTVTLPCSEWHAHIFNSDDGFEAGAGVIAFYFDEDDQVGLSAQAATYTKNDEGQTVRITLGTREVLIKPTSISFGAAANEEDQKTYTTMWNTQRTWDPELSVVTLECDAEQEVVYDMAQEVLDYEIPTEFTYDMATSSSDLYSQKN